MLLFILSLCGFSGSRYPAPRPTHHIALDFATSVGVVALLASAFALPFGFSQPFLGPMGDAFGKDLVIKVATAVLAAYSPRPSRRTSVSYSSAAFSAA